MTLNGEFEEYVLARSEAKARIEACGRDIQKWLTHHSAKSISLKDLGRLDAIHRERQEASLELREIEDAFVGSLIKKHAAGVKHKGFTEKSLI